MDQERLANTLWDWGSGLLLLGTVMLVIASFFQQIPTRDLWLLLATSGFAFWLRGQLTKRRDN